MPCVLRLLILGLILPLFLSSCAYTNGWKRPDDHCYYQAGCHSPCGKNTCMPAKKHRPHHVNSCGSCLSTCCDYRYQYNCCDSRDYWME